MTTMQREKSEAPEAARSRLSAVLMVMHARRVLAPLLRSAGAE
jgi:hypothetical protein